MAIYLVTGGAGFIGSHVVEALLEKGEKVRVLDNFSTGKRENLSALDGLDIVEGDARDSSCCVKAVKEVDYVIHLAALHEVPRSVEQPLETHEINATGILNVLLAARNAGVRRFVYASSSAVYGDSLELPRTEEVKLIPTSSPYSVTKLAGELYCALFANLYGLETVALRYFNVYGPRQDSASAYAGVIPKFVSSLLADTPPTIYGDGEQTRDFTYIADCAAATVAACGCPNVSGEVFNIGTGRRTSVNNLCTIIQKILGREIPPVFGPPQPGDIKHDYADIEKAKRFLSYRPVSNMNEGLKKTVEWYARSKA